MKKLSLVEIQKIELDILTAFDKFCRANGIKVMLAYGTLLGAVRHKGFIPWDDDVDLFVLRKDYEKLREITKNLLIDGKYKLINYDTEKSYDYPFAKVIDTSTVLLENRHDTRLSVYIDLFPIEHCGTLSNLKAALKKVNRQKQMLTASYKYYHRPKSLTKHIIKRLIRPLCRLIGTKELCRKIDNKAIESDKKNCDSNRLANIVWEDNKIIFYDESSSTSPVEIEFCNKKFYVMADYERVLRDTYGDYNKLPPEEDRVGHLNTVYLRSEL